MRTKPILVIMLVLLLTIPSIAQHRFNGRVVDEKGKPLIGANVYIDVLQKSILTNIGGEFNFDAPIDSVTIKVTYVGFRSVATVIGGGEFREVLLPKLESTIEEVIVSTGYQNIPKERATGSFGVVLQDDLDRQLSTDFKSRLEGIVPGMLFDHRSAGNHMKISIRGTSTLFSNLDPLIVLNQVPFDGSLDDINPNDIESVTVLKDAAAVSIWGARAGNGVIVITTKTGRSNTSPLLSFNTNLGIAQKPDMSRLQWISGTDFLELESFLFSEKFYDSRYTDGYSRLSPWVAALYENQEGRLPESDLTELYERLSEIDLRQQLNDHVYRHANRYQNNLSLRGGTDMYRYSYSLGYDRDISVLNQRATRITLRADQNIQITPRLSADISVFGAHSGSMSDHEGYTEYSTFPTYTQLKGTDGENLAVEKFYRNSFIDEALTEGLLNWSYRPLDEQRFSRPRSNENMANINLGIRYRLFEGLNLSMLYQFDKMYASQNTLNESDSYFTRNMINQFSQISGDNITRPVPMGDILQKSLNERQGQLGRMQLDYSHDWGNHNVTALSGVEAKTLRNTGSSSWIYGYDANNLTFSNVDFDTMFSTYSPNTGWQRIPAGVSLTGTTGKFLSAYINMGYTFMDKYFLSLSARQDGSNLFGIDTNQKFVPLWSVGGAWHINRESFFNSSLFNTLKIRATYGYNGNINTNVSSLTTMTTYTYGNINNQAFGALRNPPNASLRWEKNRMLNIGVDFSMFSNSVDGSVEYYRKNNTDLIGYMPINQTTGARDLASSTYRYLGNSASTTGSGIDVILRGFYGGEGFKMSSTAVFGYSNIKTSHYESEPATALDYINGGQVISPIVGKPAYSIFALQWAGLDPENGNPQGILNGEVSKDYAAILNETDPSELEYFGAALPLYFGSFKQTFGYRGFSFSFMLTYRLGHYFRKSGINYGALLNGTASHSDYALRWKAIGDEDFTDVPSFQFPLDPNRDNFYARSAALIGKADNLRLRDISLSYLFPKVIGVKNVTFQFYARNLGLIWKADDGEIDPEYVALGINPEYSIGIKLNL